MEKIINLGRICQNWRKTQKNDGGNGEIRAGKRKGEGRINGNPGENHEFFRVPTEI